MQYIISETDNADRMIIANFYSSYAYFLFGFEEYDLFFEMYIKAQKYGYSFEQRREFIYKSFIEPNIEKYRSNYITNIKNMIDKECILKAIEFEVLPYWLITTGNKNEYYLYNKEIDWISNKFVLDINSIELSNIGLTISYADSLLLNNDSWSEVQSYINENNYQEKRSYIVVESIGKLLSYFQRGAA